MRILATALLCLSLAAFFSEAARAGEGSGAAQDSVSGTFVPLNSRVFRFRLSDGAEQLFVRDEEEPKILHGDGSWLAELDGRSALVMSNPDADDSPGYLFYSGILRKTRVAGRERTAAVPAPGASPSLLSLWPEKGDALKSNVVPDVWKDSNRLRLWFVNPNKAGAFLAELVFLGLAFVLVRRLFCRILGGLLLAAAFCGLVATASRGAFVALLFGLFAVVVVRAKFLFNWRRLLILALLASAAVGGILAFHQGDRLGRNLLVEESRELSRLTVWKKVPRMIVDSPAGWGFGNSARAYIDWYQDSNDCLLKDLISGHLTFLVEVGWPLRFAYFFLWSLALGVLFVTALKGASPAPLALGVTFGVAAVFNPILKDVELLALPFAALVVAGIRFVGCRWKARAVIGSGVTALLLCGVLYAVGRLQDERVSICGNAGAVVLNGRNPSIWVVHDDFVLHGGYWWMFGKEVRDYFGRHGDRPAVAFARAPEAVPQTVDTLVLAGKAGEDFLCRDQSVAARKVVFLSPPFSWKRIPESLLGKSEVRLVAGEIGVRGLPDCRLAPDWVKILPGAELYLPGWLNLVF